MRDAAASGRHASAPAEPVRWARLSLPSLAGMAADRPEAWVDDDGLLLVPHVEVVAVATDLGELGPVSREPCAWWATRTEETALRFGPHRRSPRRGGTTVRESVCRTPVRLVEDGVAVLVDGDLFACLSVHPPVRSRSLDSPLASADALLDAVGRIRETVLPVGARVRLRGTVAATDAGALWLRPDGWRPPVGGRHRASLT